MDKLLIVESPNKIKTLNKFLGADFEVVATIGHIRNLDKKALGIDQDLNPKWVLPQNKERIQYIKELLAKTKTANRIYIATDPDREGEAIAWHFYDLLTLSAQKKCHRIVFNEITKKAVLEAFKKQRAIDMNWVHSQFVRRIVDRIVGFKLSQLVQKKIGSSSAGRVQSVALQFIYEREQAIKMFKPESWYTLETVLNDSDKTKLWLEKYNTSQEVKLADKIYDNKQLNFANYTSVHNIIHSLDPYFVVQKVIVGKALFKTPKPPYKTATLQQDGFNKLGWSVKKTMLIAQKLYEGVVVNQEQIGLITYPRTDSLRLSQVFLNQAKSLIQTKYGSGYFKGYVLEKAAYVQDAHEAIRPTDITLTPESLKHKIANDVWLLYRLVYNQSLAALMAPAVYKQQKVIFTNAQNEFALYEKALDFPGFEILYNKQQTDLKNYQINQQYQGQTKAQIHHTTPPPYYNQASLVAALEKSGVGRPSTYGQMVNIVLERGYVDKENNHFKINPDGIKTITYLVQFFAEIINADFTKALEERLDQIASGSVFWKEWLQQFNQTFQAKVLDVHAKSEKQNFEISDQTCPQCGAVLVIRKSWRFQKKFLSCSKFPQCKYTKNLQSKQLNQKCPQCNAWLVERLNKNKVAFIGCSSFPNCKYVQPKHPPQVLEQKCPLCQQCLIKRKNRKQQDFIGCSNYPTCKFTTYVRNNKN